MDDPTEHPPGLFQSVKRVGRTLSAIVQNRIELLLLEAEEERRRAVKALLLVAVGVVLLLLTLVVATLTIVMAAGEEHRMVVLVVITAVYALGTAGVFWTLQRHLKTWSSFPETLSELKKDKAWLDEKA